MSKTKRHAPDRLTKRHDGEGPAPSRVPARSPQFAESASSSRVFPRGEFATIQKDLDVYLGYMHRIENPDPVLRTESAGRGLKLYDEAERDAHVASVIQTRILAVVGKDWEINPAERPSSIGRAPTITREQKIADFVSRTLVNSNFDTARHDLLKAVLFGFSAIEVMWKTSGDGIVIDKFIGKHPRRFIFDKDRNMRLLSWSNMIEGEEIPDRKFITFTYGDSDNPYGRGLGQKLWWPVWFKKNVVKFWLTFLEKFGMPVVVGKYEQGAGPEQKKALFDAIDAIQNETGITIPATTEIDFLEATRAGTVSYEQCCEFMDRQISKAVLGQTLTTEVSATGSYAASKTHNEVRQEMIEADADLLDTCLNNTLIKWIVDLNFPEVTEYPQIRTAAHVKPDLTAQIAIHKVLISDLGLKVGSAYIYETYGIPEPAEGEELIKIAPKPQPPFGSAQDRLAQVGMNGDAMNGDPNNPDAATFAEGKAGLDAADQIADKTAINAGPVTDALMAPLQRLVDKAESMEDLRDSIIDLWGEMNPADLGAVIAQGMMLADMAGRYKIMAAGKKKA